MKCPKCGSESSGAFCSECGSPLKGAQCRACSAALPPGANFCTKCGTPVSTRRRTAAPLPWLVAGAALLIVIAVIAWPALRGGSVGDGRVPLSQMQGEVSGSGVPGALSGTPREQADRLFNRVMTEREAGDSARAAGFLPMAIQAYQIAGDLDADGLYHLSLLQAMSGDYSSARASAERILATSPNHLLGLSAAANAARSAGEDAAARRYYQSFLASYDAEIATAKQEYQDHAKMLPQLRSEAQTHSR